MAKITDFLNTRRPVSELRTALEVVREFKNCEGIGEWAAIPFVAWTKLEQFEEFLEFLVDGKELKQDTKDYLAR